MDIGPLSPVKWRPTLEHQYLILALGSIFPKGLKSLQIPPSLLYYPPFKLGAKEGTPYINTELENHPTPHTDSVRGLCSLSISRSSA